jgi:hypothetical protein
MNTDQGKPKAKRSGLRSLMLFAILLLVIIAALFLYVLGSGWHEAPNKSLPYPYVKDDLQNAVTAYSTDHNESLPILKGTYTNANCSACSVINISALLIANGGMLRAAPSGLNLSSSGNDNCGGNASLGCSNYGSYIWIVDTHGNVFSYCAGTGCETNNSGYQGVWP